MALEALPVVADAAWLAARKVLTRLFPWLTAAELAILLWEWQRKRQFHPRETHTVTSGPEPGTPGYAPPGYTLVEERDLGAAWEFTLTKGWLLQFDTPGSWASWTLPTGVDNPGPGFMWQQAKVVTANPTGPRAAVRKWVTDAHGTGTTVQTQVIGDTIAWPIVPDLWPVNPDALPSVLPMQAPFAQPYAAQRQGVPWRVIDEFNADDPWETGREHYEPIPDVEAAVVGDAESILDEAPQFEISADPDHGNFVPNDHVYAPAEGTKEVKLKAKKRAAMRIFGAATEVHDFVNDLHKALPKQCQRSRTWRDKKGTWHRKLMKSMLADIYACWGHMNVARAMENILLDQLQDFAIGKSNRFLNERTAAMFGTTGVQGAGTRVTRAMNNETEGPWGWVSRLTSENLGWSTSTLTVRDLFSEGLGQSPRWTLNRLGETPNRRTYKPGTRRNQRARRSVYLA